MYVTEYGSPFFINLVTKSVLGAGSVVYYTLRDCNGTTYLSSGGDEYLVPFSQIIDMVAYIPSENSVQVIIYSQRVSGGDCINQGIGGVAGLIL